MISIEKELKLFNKKYIETYEMEMNDLYVPLSQVEMQINNLGKTNKRNIMTMELLKEEIEEKNAQINDLKKQLNMKNNNEEKMAKKIVLILDQLDNIYRFAIQSQNESLISNINSLMKIIRKELSKIRLEEIPSIGEIFNEELHECVDVVVDSSKSKYEIVEVLRKGYKFNGKIIRVASVVAVK